MQHRQQGLPLRAAQVLEQVGQLGRAQPLEGPVRPAQPQRVPGQAELLDGREVQHPLGGRPAARPARQHPPQERPERHVNADHPVPLPQQGQVEVGGAHHPGAVHVDQLVVEQVLDQQRLALAALVVAQVHVRGGHPDLSARHLREVGRVHEGPAEADLHHDPGHLRVGAAVPAHHHVDQPADVAAVAVADRGAPQPGDGHQGRGHLTTQQQPTTAGQAGTATTHGRLGHAAASLRRGLGRDILPPMIAAARPGSALIAVSGQIRPLDGVLRPQTTIMDGGGSSLTLPPRDYSLELSGHEE